MKPSSKIKEFFSPKRINECDQIPKWYGVSYTDFGWKAYVCYRIPFNLLFGFTHKIYVWMATKLFITEYEVKVAAMLHEEFARGKKYEEERVWSMINSALLEQNRDELEERALKAEKKLEAIAGEK